jgi:hypothetical protein
MDRFDKFTDRARNALNLAQDEAQRFQHKYIGTEHLLLGVLRVGDGTAARALTSMGVELREARTAVEFIIGRGDRPTTGEVGLTPRAKRVIELSIDEARRLGHNYIGTEHLLLGLVREGEGIAAGVLESLGVNLDKLRHEVIRELSETSPNDRGDASQVTQWTGAGFVSGTLEIGSNPADIGSSPLVQVIGIGQVMADAGISVELIALEVRGAGCVLYWRAHSEEEGHLGQLRCTVRDDAGTAYHALPASWSGGGRVSSGQTLVTPGPPPESKTMQIDVSGFAVPGHHWTIREEVHAAWHFEFAIGG